MDYISTAYHYMKCRVGLLLGIWYAATEPHPHCIMGTRFDGERHIKMSICHQDRIASVEKQLVTADALCAIIIAAAT